MKDIFIIYLIIQTVFSFILSAIDKNAAIHQRHRISEKMLWIFAFLGGSIGLYLSMRIFRHKTRHRIFMIGVPLLIIIQTTLLIFVFR